MSHFLAFESRDLKPEPVTGDLLTVRLAGGVVSGARLERQFGPHIWVKLVGLTVPAPYHIGDKLVLDQSAIIAWDW